MPGEWVDSREAYARGRALRDAADPAVHRHVVLADARPSVADYVEASNEGRLPELIPLRVERMSTSPFAFFRGSAALMAVDLAAGPRSGMTAQLCGDAHAGNFGLYGTQDGRIVMDINDFDETAPGPWEWDISNGSSSASCWPADWVESPGTAVGTPPTTPPAATGARSPTSRNYRFSSLGPR